MNIDFKQLSATLMLNAESVIQSIVPGGRQDGNEYRAGSINGGQGKSFSFNISNGLWSDFNAGQSGNDFICLYAEIHSIKQIEAAKRLIDEYGVTGSVSKLDSRKMKIQTPPDAPSLSPINTDKSPLEHLSSSTPPDFNHYKLGAPTDTYKYTNIDGHPILYIARYEPDDGKQFRQFSFDGQKWIPKSLQHNRPLLNLPNIASTDNNILIVEGEKAARAAFKLCGHLYTVTCWPGGSNAISKTDWTPITDRSVTIWPDNDEAGLKAAAKIAAILAPTNQIKILSVSKTDHAAKFDAADALDLGWDYDDYIAFARPIAVTYQPPVPQLEYAPVYTPTHTPIYTPAFEPIDDTPPPFEYDGPPLDQDNYYRDSLGSSFDSPASTKSLSGPTSPDIDINQIQDWTKLGVETNGNGVPIMNESSCLAVLSNYEPLVDCLWYDDFYNDMFIHLPGEDSPRSLQESDIINISVMMQRNLKLNAAKISTVTNAIRLHCSLNRRNILHDWMNSLKWDGVHRVNSSFADYFGAEDNAYTAQISSNFWISMVARIMKPGCKVDNMVILEGKQGVGKSEALYIIGGEFFTDVGETVGTKDFYLKLQGSFLVEIAELDAFSKAESNTIKKVISERTDSFRAPYEAKVKAYPRHVVFVGTTNDTEYLKDPTGARRFWPIETTIIDTAGLKQDREQLFAEALVLYASGQTWWEVDHTEAKRQTDLRSEVDEWTEYVAEHVNRNFCDTVEIHDILTQSVNMSRDKINKPSRNRVATILRRMGWENRLVRSSGRVRKTWHRPQ